MIQSHFRESLPAVLYRKEAMSDCISKELRVEMGIFIAIPRKIKGKQ